MGDQPGLSRADRFIPSRRPYALLGGSFRPDGSSFVVDAIWGGRKRGRTTVTVGTLRLWTPRRPGPTTFEELLAVADMRYGGAWHRQWDGSRLLVEPTHPLTPAGYVEVADKLDNILHGLPHVPDGWDGWYYRAGS